MSMIPRWSLFPTARISVNEMNEMNFPVPKVNKLITMRLGFQNVVSTVQRWNDEILNCVGVKERICVNAVKHRQPQVFANKAQHEKHTVACYGHVTVMAAPPVVGEDVVVQAEVAGHGRGI